MSQGVGTSNVALVPSLRFAWALSTKSSTSGFLVYVYDSLCCLSLSSCNFKCAEPDPLNYGTRLAKCPPLCRKAKFWIDGDRRLYTAKLQVVPVGVSSVPVTACEARKNGARALPFNASCGIHMCMNQPTGSEHTLSGGSLRAPTYLIRQVRKGRHPPTHTTTTTLL